MNTKNIIRIVLIGFVVLSVGWLIVRQVQTPKTPVESNAPPTGDISTSGSASCSTADGKNCVSVLPNRVIVYYFHTTYRCPTCHRIENYTKEAVEAGFSQALRDGLVEFQVLNVEDQANAHFIQDYQLHTKSVVVVDVKDGKQEQWKNLTKVWELVGNQQLFLKYIQDEVGLYLQGK